MKFPRLHGVMVGGLDGKLFTVFDPSVWALHLWMWWLWKCWLQCSVMRVARAVTPWRKTQKLEVFEHGIIEFRFNGATRHFRVWRNQTKYLVWMPELDTATRVAVSNPWTDPALPQGEEVHPLERGL
jgi:hypothetical protein